MEELFEYLCFWVIDATGIMMGKEERRLGLCVRFGGSVMEEGIMVLLAGKWKNSLMAVSSFGMGWLNG